MGNHVPEVWHVCPPKKTIGIKNTDSKNKILKYIIKISVGICCVKKAQKRLKTAFKKYFNQLLGEHSIQKLVGIHNKHNHVNRSLTKDCSALLDVNLTQGFCNIYFWRIQWAFFLIWNLEKKILCFFSVIFNKYFFFVKQDLVKQDSRWWYKIVPLSTRVK